MTYRLTSLLMAIFAIPAMAGTSAPATSASGSPDQGVKDSGASRPCMCMGAHAGTSEPFSVNLTAGYDSTFFCRGMDMGDDLFSATLTVDTRLADNLVWTASARYLDVAETDFRESHLYTGLFYTAGALTFGPSFRWYHNYEGGMMKEAYDIGAQALLKAGWVNISGGYYYETESEGHFWEIGASSVIPLTDKISLVPAAEIGYTDGWMMPGLKGWNHAGLRLSLPIKATENLTVTPWIGGNIPMEALDAGQDSKLVGGVSLSLTF